MMDFNNIECQGASLLVRIWPNDTWCTVEDIREGDYSNMSNDYVDVDMYHFEQFEKLSPALKTEIVNAVMGLI